MTDSTGLPDDPDECTSGEVVAWLDALAAARDEDELFATLASQRPPVSKLARQQIRGRLVRLLGEKLRELDSGASPAKTADAWLQEGGEDGESLQGKIFAAEEIEPWHAPVVGEDVLNEVLALFDAYLYASEDSRVALTVWAAYSHAFDCFGVSPILDLSSPTKRCGKSTAVVLQRHLCRAPLLSGNITPAALFRSVEAWKPTLLIDEADTFAKMSDELRGILNAGHTRDTAFVVRAEGDANEPRMFSTWAPKVVAAIGHLPDTIEDRAVIVTLTRKPTGITKRDAFDPEGVRRDCASARRRLARFTLDNLDAIASAQVERPVGLHDRAWNNWRPLLAVATAAGQVWLDRTRRAAVALAVGDNDDSEDIRTLAVQHVWEVLEPAGRLATADVLQHLISKDEGPWAKWWESSIAKNELRSPSAKLARLLKPFGVKPRQLWINDAKTRGYDAEDFIADTCAPYLKKTVGTVEDGRPGSSSHAGSTVPHRPTDFFEAARTNGSRPLIGDEMYPALLADAIRDGHLTEAEAEEQYALHELVRRAATYRDAMVVSETKPPRKRATALTCHRCNAPIKQEEAKGVIGGLWTCAACLYELEHAKSNEPKEQT
jgi:putative DNA primase/helicase